MKKVRSWALLAVLAVIFLGCMSVPSAGTRLYVHEKMQRVQLDNTPEQVIYLMDGEPSHVTSLRGTEAVFDIWEYRVGNFFYDRPAVILFKNSRVFAFPQNSQELISILYAHGIVREAQFWDSKNK